MPGKKFPKKILEKKTPEEKQIPKKFHDTFFWLGPKGLTAGPEGPHRCSRRLEPSAGARKMPPVGRRAALFVVSLNIKVLLEDQHSFYEENNQSKRRTCKNTQKINKKYKKPARHTVL